jgi:dipicolinate synthase subunit B
MIIAPCTGNTLAKMANGITDTAVLMAAKAQLRNERPVLLAVSTNDGLSSNARNIGLLLNRKHVYMVPFGQDDPLWQGPFTGSRYDTNPAGGRYGPGRQADSAFAGPGKPVTAKLEEMK